MSQTPSYALNVVTPPARYPVTVSDMQTVLRFWDTDERDYIGQLIIGATELVELNTGVVLISTGFQMDLACFPSCEIKMPRTPLVAIDSIKYDDTNGTEQTLVEGTDYTVLLGSDRTKGSVIPAYNRYWPVTLAHGNAVRIRFTAGFGDTADTVPQTFLQQIRLLVKHWFTNRSAVTCGSMARAELSFDTLQFANERKEFV